MPAERVSCSAPWSVADELRVRLRLKKETDGLFLRGLSSQLEKRTSSTAIIMSEPHTAQDSPRRGNRHFRDIVAVGAVLSSAMTWFLLGFAFVLAVTLVYRGHAYWAWVLGGLALVPAAWSAGLTSTGPTALGVAFAALALIFGLPVLRRQLVTRPLMPAFASALPRMGETERVALDAGTVWWDGDLFSGDPDWKKLLAFEKPGLSEREKAFLDGPVEELCGMLNDWEITQARRLPTKAWEFMKKHLRRGTRLRAFYNNIAYIELSVF